MSYEKDLVNKGKHLAFLLRHDKDAFNAGLIDNNGWRDVKELCREHGYTAKMLDDIVETNNKKRYEFSNDKRKIRARQGHSITVDVELTEAIPPKMLYHGTSIKTYYDHIIKEGLKPMSRLHVHLSSDIETAKTVGARHGGSQNVVVLRVDTKAMSEDGFKFYQSNNGVWLTEHVPVDYLYMQFESK